MIIKYKDLLLERRGSRVAVSKEDGDTLGTFTGWTAAMTFVDRIRDGVAKATLLPVTP